MSKNKKLSLEEKRQRFLEFFHEKKDVFLLKDLEKQVSKEKGLPFQSVKEVLQTLVDDGLVDTDKIGTSTYFWSFPSKSYLKKTEECKFLEQKLNKLKDQVKNLDEEISIESKNVKPESQEEQTIRKEIEQEINKLENEKQNLENKLNQCKTMEKREHLETELETNRQAIERWTDNIFAIKTWCKNKTGGSLSDSEMNKMFGLPEDFDYYEEE